MSMAVDLESYPPEVQQPLSALVKGASDLLELDRALTFSTLILCLGHMLLEDSGSVDELSAGVAMASRALTETATTLAVAKAQQSAVEDRKPKLVLLPGGNV